MNLGTLSLRHWSNREKDAYLRLVNRFQAAATEPAEIRWHFLMAAHIMGQANFRLHVHSHWLMLCFAVNTRDWPEVGGQLFRLALVPLGHTLGRLPAGNTGRATVSAFRPMTLSPDLRLLVAEAREFSRAMVVAEPPDTRS
ncbi:MAG: DUF3703 domain-containing protein [Pseudomonadota bacterium]